MTDEELWNYIDSKEKPAPKKEIEIEDNEFYKWINETKTTKPTTIQKTKVQNYIHSKCWLDI